MREERKLVARVRYVPEVREKFNSVSEHYIAEVDGKEGKGRSIYDALRECDVSTWDNNIQIAPVDWPAEILDAWLIEQHTSALAEEKSRNEDKKRAAIYAERKANLDRHMKTWDLKGETVYVSVDNDGRIEVQDCGRWNSYLRKHETVIRRRYFKSDKDGAYNWTKIKGAVEEVAAYKARETANSNKSKTDEEKSKAILTGLGEHATGWQAAANGTVSFTVNAKTAEEAIAINQLLAGVMA